MEYAQPHQRNLDLFAGNRFPPQAGAHMRIVSGARAAVDVAHALGYDTDGLATDSDARLVLTLGDAQSPPRMERRRLVVDLDSRDAIEATRSWLAQVAPHVLNISGPRRSRQAGAYGRTYAFLSRVLPKRHARQAQAFPTSFAANARS